MHRRRLDGRARAAKLNPHFALLDVHLAQIVLLHQFDEATNLADIENVRGWLAEDTFIRLLA